MFDYLCEQTSARAACKLMVELLSLAHERGCEAQLATLLSEDLAASRLSDLKVLRERFAPDLASEIALEAAIQRLDRYHLLALDDLIYVTKDQAETSVLFELISTRYERRSLLIAANQPFCEWGKSSKIPR